MSIKYEIHTIENSQGTGEPRHYVQLFEQEPLAQRQLEERIQASCTLTVGDIEATLSALRATMIHELAHGRRFHIPTIGYFSLSADLDMPEGKPIDKVRADYISVRGIRFRPDASVLREVRSGASFERATFTTRSRQYDEDELWQKVKSHIAADGYITRRDMELFFGLRQYMALKWLKHFTATGRLRKRGARNSPVYFLGEEG